ncbi:hypothetical protein EWE75_15170 [Sphingomonas populi]|uniref:Uncharacterized protein n=1 Tax=Sphingomonas populi TaxID=2484750 RepID=A0A4Q6Y308_9SPHN|nr:hypothetical protein [Sphingomonas populi]RZF63667.1 hypothetical protein EWE75_15170 [Sphingomonas populi]
MTNSSDAALCSRDHVWCVAVDGKNGPLIVTANGKEGGRWMPDAADDGLQLSPLPSLLRLADGSATVAVQARESVMYSGGGGEMTTLRLLHIRTGEAPRVVLSVPWKTDLMIRACFSDKDTKARAGACHDQYEFDGQLAVAQPAKSGPPTLTYTAKAQSFPRGVSRNADSLSLPPLKKSDLIWVSDRDCSYRRTLSFDPASGAYKPDAPLPDCGQYTSSQ